MEGQWAPCGEGDPVGEHRRQVAPEAAGQPAGLSAHWCPCVGCPAPQPSGLWWKNGPSPYQDPNRLQRRGAQGAPSGRLVTDSHCLAYPAPSPVLAFSFLSLKEIGAAAPPAPWRHRRTQWEDPGASSAVPGCGGHLGSTAAGYGRQEILLGPPQPKVVGD